MFSPLLRAFCSSSRKLRDGFGRSNLHSKMICFLLHIQAGRKSVNAIPFFLSDLQIYCILSAKQKNWIKSTVLMLNVKGKYLMLLAESAETLNGWDTSFEWITVCTLSNITQLMGAVLWSFRFRGNFGGCFCDRSFDDYTWSQFLNSFGRWRCSWCCETGVNIQWYCHLCCRQTINSITFLFPLSTLSLSLRKEKVNC